MNRDEEKTPAAVYVYAGFNLLVRTVRLIAYGAAFWMAIKPGGSILAALLMAIIASAMKTRSYAEDFDRYG
ncbi:hypothetical protein [Stutzerimonas nitrititolerans]|uniref:hypothetical protein n=1 Tax=Stutzerimonas nitrititolerans TaxID=2482751 RepID=UPI0028A1CD3A|nr:hypothetical protein [Stutzerimonas nitrititolerans]